MVTLDGLMASSTSKAIWSLLQTDSNVSSIKPEDSSKYLLNKNLSKRPWERRLYISSSVMDGTGKWRQWSPKSGSNRLCCTHEMSLAWRSLVPNFPHSWIWKTMENPLPSQGNDSITSTNIDSSRIGGSESIIGRRRLSKGGRTVPLGETDWRIWVPYLWIDGSLEWMYRLIEW